MIVEQTQYIYIYIEIKITCMDYNYCMNYKYHYWIYSIAYHLSETSFNKSKNYYFRVISVVLGIILNINIILVCNKVKETR